jgi:hypothetical protein
MKIKNMKGLSAIFVIAILFIMAFIGISMDTNIVTNNAEAETIDWTESGDAYPFSFTYSNSETYGSAIADVHVTHEDNDTHYIDVANVQTLNINGDDYYVGEDMTCVYMELENLTNYWIAAFVYEGNLVESQGSDDYEFEVLWKFWKTPTTMPFAWKEYYRFEVECETVLTVNDTSSTWYTYDVAVRWDINLEERDTEIIETRDYFDELFSIRLYEFDDILDYGFGLGPGEVITYTYREDHSIGNGECGRFMEFIGFETAYGLKFRGGEEIGWPSSYVNGEFIYIRNDVIAGKEGVNAWASWNPWPFETSESLYLHERGYFDFFDH